MRAANTTGLALAIALLAASFSPAWAQEAQPARRYRELEFPPLRAFTPPEPSRHVLSNGVVVFLLEDHEFPTIDLVGRLRVGAIAEPRERAGLAALCGEVMRSGGTAEWPGDALDEELERRAIELELGFQDEEGSVGLSVLSGDLERGLAVLSGVLRAPALPEEKLALAKRSALSRIARRNDSPGRIAYREFRKLLYGNDAVWSREVDPGTMGRISREDLEAFHRRHVGPDSLCLGVWGDFEEEAMVAALERHLGGWAPAGTEPPPVPEVDTELGPTVCYVAREDVNQSSIQMGHLGGLRRPKDPDYPALLVMNSILGGGDFASRLFQRIRTEMGLAYAVDSSYSGEISHPGVFRVSIQTKSESTVAAIRAVVAEVRRIQDEPVSAEELKVAREAFLDSMVFAYAERSQLIARRLFYEFEGWPTDHLQWLQEAVGRVSAEDVQRVARTYLHPEALRMVVVGKGADFDAPLATLVGEGEEVHALDVELHPYEVAGEEETAPGAAAAVEATPERLAHGRELAARAVEAMGGMARLQAVETIVIEAETVLTTPQGSLPATVTYKMRFPDKVRVEVLTPMGLIVQCVDGKTGWFAQGTLVMDMNPAQAAALRERLDQSDYLLLPAAARGEVPAVHLGLEGARERVRLDLGGGQSMRLDFDTASGLLVRREQDSAMGTSATEFSEHREAGGILCPFRLVSSMNGEESQRLEARSVRFNEPLPADVFLRPRPAGQGPGR